MALKDTWVNKIDGVDISSANDINDVAQAVIDLENETGSHPDFAANEGEKGFIKNRTHYIDKDGKVHTLPIEFIPEGVAKEKYVDDSLKALFVPRRLSEMVSDKYHRTVEDDEKAKWNDGIIERWEITENYTASSNIVIAQQSLSSGIWMNRKYDIEPGMPYAVYIGGKEYFCVAGNEDGTIYLGNPKLFDSASTQAHNNEPFCITWAGGAATAGMFFKDSTLSYPITLKVTGAAVTMKKKLQKEYLPDDVAMKSDIPEGGGVTSWNDLTDKPFSEGAGELWFTYTATFATDAAAKNGVLAKDAMGNTLSWLEVNGELLKVHREQEGMTVGWYDADGNKWVTSTFAGVYVIAQTAGTYTYKFYAPSDELMLEPQYLPPNLAKKSDIPEGGSGANIDVVASVGQTIVVEEVDADGKPTKWKAADYQPRTHWGELREVQPSTTITPFYYEALGVPMGQMSNFDIVVGNKYKVIFDGVEYIREAFEASVAGITAPAVGNAAVAGGANTGEPFAICKVAGDDWVTAIFFDMTPHTVQVFEDTVTPIPVQYVTNALPYYIDVVEILVQGNSQSLTCNETVDNVTRAINCGRNVILRLDYINYNDHDMTKVGGTFFAYYPLGSRMKDDSVLGFFGNGDTMSLTAQADGTFVVSHL